MSQRFHELTCLKAVFYVGACSCPRSHAFAPGDFIGAICSTAVWWMRSHAGHSNVHETIFDTDNLTLLLQGKVVGRIAEFIGTANEFPEWPNCRGRRVESLALCLPDNSADLSNRELSIAGGFVARGLCLRSAWSESSIRRDGN